MCPPDSSRFKLDDHEVAGAVERQEVDSPAGVLPVAELLGHHKQLLAEYGDPVAQ